ncbi:MAG: DUF1577 domain-containing protein [bacterium]|nr:DUF1577 domain-containing protein [bacterium]
MSFLKDTQREVKSVKELDKINGIITKYVNINDLQLKSPFYPQKIDIHEYSPGKGIFIVSLENEDHPKNISLFTIVSGRHIQLNLEMQGPGGEGYPNGCYKYKVVLCSLASQKREAERNDVDDMSLKISHLVMPKIKEKEKEIRKALSIKIIIKSNLDRLKDFDLKVYVDSGEENKPPEVQYALERGGLYISNTANLKSFYEESESFFKSSETIDLEKNLKTRLEALKESYVSLLVKPVEYITTLGDFFTIGYIVLGTKEKIIDDVILESTNTFFLELSNKLKDGNYIDFDITGDIINISGSGISVEFTDPKPVKYIIEHGALMFNLIPGKLESPIRVSGVPVYVYKLKNGFHRVGIKFLGSQYGPGLEKIILSKLEKIKAEQKAEKE